MKCTLSINRPTLNGESDAVIEIVLRIQRGKTITVPVSPADFALAVTGKSDVPAEMRLRGVSVVPAGMVATALQDLRDRATSEGGRPKVEPLAKVRFDAAINEGMPERDAFYEAVQCMEEVAWRFDPVSDARAVCIFVGATGFKKDEAVQIAKVWLPEAYGLPEYPVYFMRHKRRGYMLTPAGVHQFVHVPTGAIFRVTI